MAKIVCIAEGTVREGICEVGDVVSIHDDNVELTGSGYTNFTIIEMPGLTATQVRESFNKIQPEEAEAYRSEAAADEWTLDRPEEKQVWKDPADTKWKFLEAPPKYKLTMAYVTEAAKLSLADDNVSVAARLLTIESQTKEKISLDTKNLVEAVDLNKVIAEEPK